MVTKEGYTKYGKINGDGATSRFILSNFKKKKKRKNLKSTFRYFRSYNTPFKENDCLTPRGPQDRST